MATYFSEYFKISPAVLESHGAFNVSLVTDLPLFIDPFLLFNSKNERYQTLHNDIIRYLSFLRDKAVAGALLPHLRDAWCRFSEVKQTWLGFTKTGNAGSGLGAHFATALSQNLNEIFRDFGTEKVTKGSHLEKLCLITGRVGRDYISDFTTNLIKAFLCDYTQTFARQHIAAHQRKTVAIPRVRFNYDTESWMTLEFELPWADGDYVILTPKDILTKDDTWINKGDLVADFPEIAVAMPDGVLRAQVSNYFEKAIPRYKDKQPSQRDRNEAARRTILKFPEMVDYFIRLKEDRGNEAKDISAEKVSLTQLAFIEQIQQLQQQLAQQTDFYKTTLDSHAEAHQRVAYMKDVIEHKGGHRIFYVKGKPVQREEDVQTMFRLVWYGTPSDVSREVNDGRGPADFKVSRGSHDKTIVEFKLAKNKSLERNLARQVELYQKASDAKKKIKVIVYFNDAELARVHKILKRLKCMDDPDIVLIDAQARNKPAASRA